MRDRHLVRRLLPALLVAFTACGSSGDTRSAAAQNRTFEAVRWKRVWQTGGTEADTTLLQPWKMAVSPRHVFVLDKAGTRVAAFRRSDGAIEWITGSKGSGPAEFLLPTTLAVSQTGDVWVADAKNSRITVIASDGSVRRSIALQGLPYPESLCALPQGGMLLATSGSGQPLLHLTDEGTIASRMALPWPDLADTPPLATQALLTPSEDGCILALALGRGFAVYTGDSFRTYAYVDSFPLPVVETKREVGGTLAHRVVDMRVAAQAAAAAGGEISVSPGGRVIDVYSRRNGLYLRSVVTPTNIVAFARADDVYYVLTFQNGYPALVAARPLFGRDSAASRG